MNIKKKTLYYEITILIFIFGVIFMVDTCFIYLTGKWDTFELGSFKILLFYPIYKEAEHYYDTI